MPLVTLSDMWELPVPEQLFSYAEAYRGSSAALCQNMHHDSALCTWSNGTVVLLLAAHAVELFLKGALLKKNPGENVWDRHHDLDGLSAEYRSKFVEPSFQWDIPFTFRLTEEQRIAALRYSKPDLSEKQIQEIKRLDKTMPAPSVLFRYPVDKGGQQWRGLYGFEPHGFLLVLHQLENDFERIKSQL